MPSGMGATCSVMEWTTRPLKYMKYPFSVYTEKYIQTQEKSAKTLFIGLQISINPPYTSIGFAF